MTTHIDPAAAKTQNESDDGIPTIGLSTVFHFKIGQDYCISCVGLDLRRSLCVPEQIIQEVPNSRRESVNEPEIGHSQSIPLHRKASK